MITIKESVEQALYKDYVAIESLGRGLMNLSSYARHIQLPVANLCKKEVGIQSIVVTLARLEKELHEEHVEEVTIEQLSVQTPIAQFVFERNEENMHSLIKTMQILEDRSHTFFSFSTSTKDIAIWTVSRQTQLYKKVIWLL
jgi:hypothetical protein